MTNEKRKELMGFTGLLTALTLLLLPISRISISKVAEATEMEIPAVSESVVSADYACDDGLFDGSRMHTVNLHITDKNWKYMTVHATDEVYVPCDVEIDGELVQNVAIRPKGNSSLSSISQQGSTHFSFKIEFDHNQPEITYHGLDKLSLNNLGQDPSCMKDFMAYHLMNDMGVEAPLSSYTVLQINGVDFGLYLAVEAVEDSFCYRNYGENYGQLYKPDSFSMDTLDTSSMLEYHEGSSLWVNEQIMDGTYYSDTVKGDRADILGAMLNSVFTPERTAVASLQYVGGMTDDYQDLWETSVFHPKKADKVRLVQSIDTLNHSENPQSVLDVDSLLRYFAVHSFVNNYDSYTSLFVHNFYLHEQDGILSMIPWDYNLAFGSFSYESAVSSVLGQNSDFNAVPEIGNAMDTNWNMINYPIDTPVYSIDMKDRPILNALLSDENTLSQYHEIYCQLLENCFENGKYQQIFQHTYEMLLPYVENGLTFYQTEQFEKGAEAMGLYLHYRAESVRGQLDNIIPSTLEGQHQNAENLVNPEGLNLANLADFGSLVPLLNETTVDGILHAVLRNQFDYDTKGAVKAVHYYSSHPLALVKCIPDLLKIQPLRKLVLQKIAPFLWGVVLLIVAVVAFKKFKRRSLCQSQPMATIDISTANDPFFASN